MASQQGTFDWTQKLPPDAQARIAAGMQQADENADGRWKHIFDACVLAAARRLPELTVDDVLVEIEKLPEAPSTHNLAAMGPAMKRAAQMGVIKPSERVVRSRRPIKNGNYHKVWLSNYYEGK